MLRCVLFGRVLPAAANPARAGWILAVLALASVLVFWSGLPFALGFARRLQRRAAPAAPAPSCVGLLAVAAAVVACFIG